MDKVGEIENDTPEKYRGYRLVEERLREKAGRGAIVVVSVAHPVGVEPHLAVVEVEDRRVVELAIDARILPSSIRGTGT